MENYVEKLKGADPFSSWLPFIAAATVGLVTIVRSYFGGPDCPSSATITGKTVVVTGGSSGVGLQVVVNLIQRGGRVIVGARNPEAAENAIHKAIRKKKLKLKGDPKLIVKNLDLASLKSVKEFVEALDDEPKIDILINNAGIAFGDFHLTEEGFETHLITNYLSHFLLTHLLLPKLKASNAARIINVSAQAHYLGDLILDDMNLQNDFHYNKAFGQSKLALVMMAVYMSKILEGTNVTINAMHPGLVRSTKQYQKSVVFTSFFGKLAITPWAWLFMKTPEQGAQTIIYMAVASELQNTSGKYFSDCKITDPSPKSLDEALCAKLYQKSLQLTGLLNKQITLKQEPDKQS